MVIIEATEEVGVEYEAQYGNHVSFVRPLDDWMSVVEWQGVTVRRFIKHKP